MRAQDVPAPDDLDEFHADLTTKRLGMSHTVSRQIDRYRRVVARDGRVDRAEVVALVGLAGRRRDADQLFAEAGRRAAQLAAQAVKPLVRRVWRTLPAFGRGRVGMALARRALRDIFDVELVRDGHQLTARATERAVVEATPNGSACRFYSSAIAATLRAFTDFGGVVSHESCRATGASVCEWSTGGPRKD